MTVDSHWLSLPAKFDLIQFISEPLIPILRILYISKLWSAESNAARWAGFDMKVQKLISARI